MVVDFGSSSPTKHLRDAVEDACVLAGHALFAGEICPPRRGEEKEAPLNASLKEKPGWLEEWREPLILKRDEPCADLKRTAGDFPLPMRDARRNQHRAMRGCGEELSGFLLKEWCANCRRRVFGK